MPSSRQSDQSDLSLIGQILRRRIWVIVVCVIAATLAAVALTARAEKQYASTAALLLRTAAGVEPQRAVDTNLQLLSLPVIARRTADVTEFEAEEVESAIATEQQGESDIILVKATTTDPDSAALMANTFAEQFIEFQKGANRVRLQTGRVQVVEQASPDSSAVSPKPLRNVIFGALIGLVLGLGLAILLEQLDRRIKRQDDLAEATGLQLLATIPKRKAFDSDHLGHESLSPAETEVFRLLRANLRYFKVRQDVRSVLVTSAEPGEGKTLVAFGLALAAVTSGERVLLLEADLRDPGLSRVLDLAPVGGLSRALTSDDADALARATIGIRAGEFADAIGDATLDVVPAGGIPPNPTELIESQRMRKLLQEAEEKYDFVVIDTPPVLVVSDSIPLMSAVSGVLAVSGLGVSTRSSAGDLAEQLERLGAPTLGLVANFAEHTGRAYEGYGYGRPPSLDAINAGGGRR